MNRFQFVFSKLKPYKLHVGLNIFFNLLTSLFSLFSFASIIPFLDILFGGKTELLPHPGEFEFSSDYILGLLNHHIAQFISEQGKMEALLYVCFFIVSMFIMKNICRYFAFYHMAPIRNGVVRDIRESIHQRMLKLPIFYFSEERKGNLITKVTSDVTEIEWSIIGSLEMIFRDPITFIIYLGTMFLMNWKLTLFVLILLPISGIIISSIAKKLKKAAQQGQNKLGEVISIIEESLSGMRILKAFNAEEQQHDKFNKENNHYYSLMVKLFRRQYMASPISEVLGATSLVVVLFYGGNLILNDTSNFDGAFFVTFLIIFSQLIPPAKSFSEAFFKLKKGMASANRINELFLAEEEPVVKGKNLPLKEFNSSIVLKNLNFKYPNGKTALKQLNLEIKKGETVALVGQSGSGKSTLISLLPAFFPVEKGLILLDGTCLTDYNLRDLRKLFGIVTQDAILFNDTIANNIAVGNPNATREEIEQAAKIANAHEFISSFENGYDYRVGDGGTKLSGGQKQRVSIARAILKNPPILLLDEATSALDTESEKLVQDALTKLMQNRTSIVIAHRLSTINQADRIVVMHDGEIAEIGTHKELLDKKGKYYNLHTLQQL
ncbi:ABC transporter ATP-binding protein [Luteibaculum oceani]|uniref:ABC transporter ATP-binding protein n=1 Tax=Luteibaculum oceani TaxID=1294296 RepID=A0A5C6V8J0_9FLAO|nr:ABC transporter ATP-binding protein [Luteibaculum oceani]TXC81702.1 ABC transporter ATP-binding protein [Luteibaculum oceani]